MHPNNDYRYYSQFDYSDIVVYNHYLGITATAEPDTVGSLFNLISCVWLSFLEKVR